MKGISSGPSSPTRDNHSPVSDQAFKAAVPVSSAASTVASTSHAVPGDRLELTRSGTDKAFAKSDLTKAVAGLKLDDGKAKATSLGFSLGKSGAHLKAKKEISPEEQAAKKAKKADAEKQKQFGRMEARVNDRMSRRVPNLPSPAHVDVDHDKLDGYALNSAHRAGGHKSEIYAKAGYKRINSWEEGKPETWRKPAANDPEYQAGRNALIEKLKSDVKTIHATRNPDRNIEKYYTKHTLLAPTADERHRPVVAKAA